MLAKHFHPSVRVFVAQVMKGDKIRYEGDALEDFQPMRFLDRFVYKNPKKPKAKPSDDFGEAGEEEAKTTAVSKFQRKSARKDGDAVDMAVNSSVWLKQATSGQKALAPTDEFFYRFFAGRDERARATRKQLKRAAKEEAQADDEAEAITGQRMSDEEDADEEDSDDDSEAGEMDMGGGDASDVGSEGSEVSDQGLMMGGEGSGDESEEGLLLGGDDSGEESAAEGSSENGEGDESGSDGEGEGEDGESESEGGYSDMDDDDEDEEVHSPPPPPPPRLSLSLSRSLALCMCVCVCVCVCFTVCVRALCRWMHI